MKSGVSTKIILLCLGLVVFTSVSFGIFSYIKNTQAVTDSIVAQKQNELNLISLHIKSKIDELNNDVVFMDVQMPVMNGIEATEYIRQNLNLSYRPYIIGLSANVFPEDKKRGLQAGMDAYLEKPLNRGQILEELKKVDHKLSQAS